MENEKIELAAEHSKKPISMTSPSPEKTSHAICNSALDEPSTKRIKLEHPELDAVPLVSAAVKDPVTLEPSVAVSCAASTNPLMAAHPTGGPFSTGDVGEPELVTCSDNSHTSGSNTSLPDRNPTMIVPAASSTPNPTTANGPPCPPPPPTKATTMMDLKMKYLDELEYMLREFRKLERQLLGAKGAAKLEESAGSRERREKLHSFILHLEETVQQIEEGCVLELEKNALGTSAQGGEAGKTEDEENVQRLEEHILANLLPVKIRLKKQLAAQQGATKNPPGMPAPRRGSLQPTNLGKGTFAAAAEERRKQAEAAQLAAQEREQALQRVSESSQFGKPLGGGGSSLTQKLHGATLGSMQRTHGHGVGTTPRKDEASPQTPKILYAGMVPQSTQHKSSLIAASGVHEIVVQDPNFIESRPDIGEADSKPTAVDVSVALAPPVAAQAVPAAAKTRGSLPKPSATIKDPVCMVIPTQSPESDEMVKKPHEDINISEVERRKLRKRRRRRKLMRLANRREKERQLQLAAQQAQAAQGAAKPVAGRKKSTASKPPGKKGPKSVEYMCALCSETYTSTCDYNPWWALAQHECPKCRKMQIPRIDISAPANAIDYHPALLAHADDNNNGGGSSSAPVAAPTPSVQVVHVAQATPAFTGSSSKDRTSVDGLDSDSDSELSELSDDSLSDDSFESDDDDEESLDFQAMSQAEQAEHECFGEEYTGPVLSEDDASRMLVVMAHASTCPCHHKLTRHRDVCRSTKFMMLHVRDCPGTTASFDVCPFPWCRKVKHLLYHLVSCETPESCRICSPSHLSESLKNLSGLNKFRVKKHRQRMMSALKARNSTAKAKGAPAPDIGPVAIRPTPRKVPNAAKSVKKTIPIIPAAAVGAVAPAKQRTPEPMQVAKPKSTTVKCPAVHAVPSAVPSAVAQFLTAPKPIPSVKEESPEQDLTTMDAPGLVSTASALDVPQKQLHAAEIAPTTNPAACGIAVADVTDGGSSILGAQDAPSEGVSGRHALHELDDVPVEEEGIQRATHMSQYVSNSVPTHETPVMEYPATPDVEEAKVHTRIPSSQNGDHIDTPQPIDGREMSRMKTNAQQGSTQMEPNEKDNEVSISNAMASRPSSGALKIAC